MVFAHGQIVCAGAAEGSLLLDGLRAAGSVPDPILESATRTAGVRDLPLLDALAHLVDSSQLTRVVRARVVETVFDLFLGEDDVYTFAPGPPHELSQHFSESVDGILTEVTGRLREWAEIAQSIPSTDVVFRLVRHLPHPLEAATIDTAEWTALAAVDGRRSVAQVISAVGTSAKTVCAGLHRLNTRGLIERVR